MSTVNIGDTNAGFKVIAVKKGAAGHISIVLAEKLSGEAGAVYVTWAFDHSMGFFKWGMYCDDRTEAEKTFKSRKE